MHRTRIRPRIHPHSDAVDRRFHHRCSPIDRHPYKYRLCVHSLTCYLPLVAQCNPRIDSWHLFHKMDH